MDADLFRFEVPTSAGRFVVIGPDTLPREEAGRIGAQIGRLIPLLVLAPLPARDEKGRFVRRDPSHG